MQSPLHRDISSIQGHLLYTKMAPLYKEEAYLQDTLGATKTKTVPAVEQQVLQERAAGIGGGS